MQPTTMTIHASADAQMTSEDWAPEDWTVSDNSLHGSALVIHVISVVSVSALSSYVLTAEQTAALELVCC